MSRLTDDLSGKPWLYAFGNPRCDVILRMMWDHSVSHVPIVDLFHWQGSVGPVVMGVITDRDVAIACWTRGTSPRNVSSQSAMQRHVYQLWGSESSRDDSGSLLADLYAAIEEHFRAAHA